jgi:two-component system, LuxR family, response regulator FixJ
MTTAPALIYLLDDDPAVLGALRTLLSAIGYRVSAHADAVSLLAAVDGSQHGCIVIDIRLAGANGLALPPRLQALGIRLPFVVISGHADVTTTAQAFKLGAVDLLQKPIHEQSLIDAIDRALARDAAHKQVERAEAVQAQRMARLSPRELGVLRGIAQGCTSRELAQAWGVSVRTVESHRASLFDKLQVQHVIELAPYAQRIGRPGADGH